jgi:hypothetical protein
MSRPVLTDQAGYTTIESARPDTATVAARSARGSAPAHRGDSWLWAVGLALLLILEALILHNFAAREVAPFVPLAFDQSGYLADSYRLFEDFRSSGLLTGLVHAVVRPAVQGILLVPLASLNYLVLGPGRLSALDLNVVAFLSYLAVTAVLLGRAFGPRTAAVAIGLILAIKSTFAAAGGFADFRYDFATMCVWGVLLATTAFPIRGRSWFGPVVLTTAVGLLLISVRTITAAYVIPVYATVSALRLVGRYTRRSSARADEPVPGLGPTFRPLVFWVSGALLIIAINIRLVLEYYVRGHVTSSEKSIRAAQAGVTDLLSSVTYYPSSVSLFHLGWGASVLLVTCVVLSAGIIAARGRATASLGTHALRFAFLGLALAIPYVPLTLDESKSPVVGTIFVPALILAAAIVVGVAESIVLATRSRAARWAMSAAALVALTFGLWVQLQTRLSAGTPLTTQVSTREAGRLVLTGGDYVARYLGGGAAWSTDAHYDFVGRDSVVAYYYEQRGQLLDLSATDLGHSTVEALPTPDQIMGAAAASDVLVLTREDVAPATSTIPADNATAALAGQLRAYADTYLISLGDFEVNRQVLTLYVRPAVAMRGTSGPWVTDYGLDLLVPAVKWSGPACITLDGSSNLAWLPALPQVTTTFRTEAGERRLPASFEATSSTSYTIRVELPEQAEIAQGGTVHVDFSTSFVPAEVGASPDTRHLVVATPTATRLREGSCRSR